MDRSLAPVNKRKRTRLPKKRNGGQKKPNKQQHAPYAALHANSRVTVGVMPMRGEDIMQDLQSPTQDRELASVAVARAASLVNQELQKKPENRASWLEDAEPLTLSKTLTLKERIKNCYNVSSAEACTVDYYKEDFVLTLSWEAGGVFNPFGSRPCSGPCMGRYIAGAPENFKLPELVPVRTLNAFREHIALGYDAGSWAGFLANMRKSQKLMWPLAVDIWSVPCCLICRLNRAASFALDPNSTRKALSLGEFQQHFMIQIPDMSPGMCFTAAEINVEIELQESGVLLDMKDYRIPFMCSVIEGLRLTNLGKTVDASSLYEK